MKLTAFVAAVLLGTTAMAQTAAPAPAAPTYTFALKGFVSMSSAYQTGTFNNEGQLSNYAATPGPAAFHDDSSLTFDVRHSRFNFSVKGPPTMFGATPSAILEIDFMGGFGAGANGSASLVNRLRVAVAELNWGSTKIQAGQQNDLIFAMAPTSLSHIGQPLGYATGNTGWRRPGVFGFHTLPVNQDLALELAWEVARGNWSDAASATGGGNTNTPTGIALAEASSSPAFEGRVTASYAKLFTVWAAGHWHQVDLNGLNNTTTTAPANVHTIAVKSYNAGAKVTLDLAPVALTLQGTGFIAQNGAPLVANFASYAIGPKGNENVDSHGWWAQAGLNLTKEFSVWGFYGQQQVDKTDYVRANGGAATAAYDNATTNVMAMYRDGGYGISAEWINFKTKYPTAINTTTNTITTSRTAKADQYMLTANYFF